MGDGGKSGRATLEEMAEACREQADRISSSLKIHADLYPDHKPDMKAHRDVFVLESAAHVFRAMATYEDKSRKFVIDLLKEHGRG